MRRFQGISFEKKHLQPFLKDGINVGVTHLYIDPQRVKDWQKTLEEILRRV